MYTMNYFDILNVSYSTQLRRKKSSDASLIDDQTLEDLLFDEWISSAPDIKKQPKRKRNTSKKSRDLDIVSDEFDFEDDSDVIEVYDENGELIGSYSASEYSRLKLKQIL